MARNQKHRWTQLELGTCYYPEHWPKTLWVPDLQLMKENGINTIRIAEFAWSKFEPKEGEFTFSFFDEFLDIAYKNDMKVIFCTPTATPPAWLTNKYPEVLNARIDGVKYQHGMRWQYNYNSPKYNELCARLVEKMAAHYAKHPAIIGWQIDNEFNGEVDVFYSESDTLAFRSFLKEKYHNSLSELNDAWGTTFWNQTYTAWDEIYVPRITPQNSTNPHEMLDYHRFISYSAEKFCYRQAEILRRYKKDDDFITTNGMYKNINHHKMTDDSLDVYMYDSYPNYAFDLTLKNKQEDLKDRNWSSELSIVRSISPHFGIMEQQSGPQGWNTQFEAPAPKPGQMMLWTMQSVAHGADYVSFFRWRTCTKGTEIYWHGILDYDNRPNRKLEEVNRIHKRIVNIQELIGSDFLAEVAVLRDYDNIWDAQFDVWHKRVSEESELAIFTAMQLSHTPMDYLYFTDSTTISDLCKYKVLIYPHGIILSKNNAELLKEYVRRGGYLLFGARTGMKDENGQCPMTYMPGLLSSISGSDVKDFTFIGAGEKMSMLWDGNDIPTGVFSDILEPIGDAHILATYTHDYYQTRAALIENSYGKGKVLHFGGTFTIQNVLSFLRYLKVISPYQGVMEIPDQCELVVRKKGKNLYFFVLNFVSNEQTIIIKQPDLIDMDSGHPVSGNIVLKPFETKVYRSICQE